MPEICPILVTKGGYKPMKREGAPRGSFLSQLLLPSAFGFRSAVLRFAMDSMAASKTVVARILDQRGLIGRLTPYRACFRRLALAILRHPLTSFN